MGEGPLVKVKIGPRRYAKMHRKHAIEAGLLKPEKKKRKGAEDKMRKPEADKQIADEQIADCRPLVLCPKGEVLQIAGCDDFSTIRGIGAVMAKALRERGITTFEQLRTVEVSDLPGRVRRAIEDWKGEDG